MPAERCTVTPTASFTTRCSCWQMPASSDLAYSTGASSDELRRLRSHRPSSVTRPLSRVLGPPRPAMPAKGGEQGGQETLRRWQVVGRARQQLLSLGQHPSSASAAHLRSCSCHQRGAQLLVWWHGCTGSMAQGRRSRRAVMALTDRQCTVGWPPRCGLAPRQQDIVTSQILKGSLLSTAHCRDMLT